MTATGTATTGTTTPAGAPLKGAFRSDAGRLWRGGRAVLIVILLIVLVGVTAGMLRGRNAKGNLDPNGTSTGGARALRVLLNHHGVDVRRRTDTDRALSDARNSTTGAVVMVPLPDMLTTGQLRRLGQLGTGTRVVLVNADDGMLERLGVDVRTSGSTTVRTRDPQCGLPAAKVAGRAVMGGTTYRGGDGESCYPDGGGTLVTATVPGGAELIVLGAGDALTNGKLGEQGDAALGLALLGADPDEPYDTVDWLMPGGGATHSDENSVGLSDLLPGWAVVAFTQLLFAGLIAALWRARRLGPPVTEPLPVVVRAAEAVEGRGRLYRRGRARDVAAEALRSGARAKVVPRLGLGTDPPMDAVVAAVSRNTGWPAAHVGALLYGAVPADDAGLVRLADDLDLLVTTTLDREVRRP
ncbi:MAG: DUF4350 domain-containing protein [Mycobacteriales bacterium]